MIIIGENHKTMKPLTFTLKANQNNNNNCDGKIWNNKQLIKLTKRQAREKKHNN